MRYNQPIMPLNVISYLRDIHKYYKEECIVEKDWKDADKLYNELLKAYHIYSGIKTDYRKKSKAITRLSEVKKNI
jgi:hypothetical protein